jgi:hypothetical protein
VAGVVSLDAAGDPAIVTPDGSIGVYFAAQSAHNATVRVWELGPTRAQEVRFLNVVVDPPGDDLAGERAVIRNDRRVSVALAGWTLTDERDHTASPPFTFRFPNVQIEPGADLAIWTKSGVDDAANLYWGLNHPVWNNRGGDAALLYDPTGRCVARLAW